MTTPDPLPPDLDRLLVIEAHLRRQQAENAAVATYLQLELDRVRDAIGRAQQPAPAPAAETRTPPWRAKAQPYRK